jgi:beta-glucanase (GH16 family)
MGLRFMLNFSLVVRRLSKPLSAVLVLAALVTNQNAHASDASTVSSAPQAVGVTRGDKSATVRWETPTSDGGTSITGYIVSLSGTGYAKSVTVPATARSAKFTKLINGRAYLASVMTTNSVGNSPISPSIRVIPSTTKADVPELPIIKSASVASHSASLSFSLGNNNGSTVTLVQFSIDKGKTWTNVLGNPINISNLTNGTVYTVLVRAKNYMGFGGAASKVVKPVGVPNSIGFVQPLTMAAGSADQELQTSADGGVTVVTSVTPTVCTVVDGKLHALAVGVCTLAANNAGNATYAPAKEMRRSVTIFKGSLLIKVTSLTTMGLDSADQLVNASAAGGTIVIISTTPTVCSIVNRKIHAIATGTCRITISNAGNSSFNAAQDVDRAVLITQVAPTITPAPTSTSTGIPTATPTPTSTPSVDPTPTATATSVPAVAYLRLTDADKTTMTDHCNWWSNEPQSHSWVKFVTAGDTLTLHYQVTSGTGFVIAGVPVTLQVNPGSARFTGTNIATTDQNGVATFTFVSTTDPANAEPRPVEPSTMSFWDNSRKVSPEVKYDLTPTIGAAAEHIDRVWTHTVRPEGWTPPQLNKTLLWSDEFTGAVNTSPSSDKWFTTTGDGCALPDNNCGWGNGERQTYAASASKLDGSTDGNLIITATRNSDSANRCYYGTCDWISGKLTTFGKVSFTYGYLETRLKIPPAAGAWPAFWMLGTDVYKNPWPGCGEIDIQENLNSAPFTNWGTAHWAKSNGSRIQGPRANTTVLPTRLSDDYHTYGILWKPGSITWYLDGIPSYTLNASDYSTTKWPFGKTLTDSPKFYAILNVAMGGQGGNPDPTTTSTAMTVDYVRYYSVDGLGTLNLP